MLPTVLILVGSWAALQADLLSDKKGKDLLSNNVCFVKVYY